MHPTTLKWVSYIKCKTQYVCFAPFRQHALPGRSLILAPQIWSFIQIKTWIRLFLKVLFYKFEALWKWLTWDNFVVVAGRSGRLNFFWDPMAAGNGGAENTAATQLILFIHPCISSVLLRETDEFMSTSTCINTLPIFQYWFKMAHKIFYPFWYN